MDQVSPGSGKSVLVFPLLQQIYAPLFYILLAAASFTSSRGPFASFQVERSLSISLVHSANTGADGILLCCYFSATHHGARGDPRKERRPITFHKTSPRLERNTGSATPGRRRTSGVGTFTAFPPPALLSATGALLHTHTHTGRVVAVAGLLPGNPGRDPGGSFHPAACLCMHVTTPTTTWLRAR